jgi:hypothetical protein
MAGPLGREFESFAAIVADLKKPKNAPFLVSSSPSAASRVMGELSAHFIKYNSTLNAQWRIVTQKGALSRGACTKFLSGATALQSPGALTLDTVVYNPLGNTLSRIAAPSSIEFMHAMCDLDGMVRIVELQLQARMQHVNEDGLVQFAANAGVRYSNPFTGRPMHFDAALRTMALQPVALRDRVFFPWPLTATHF